MSVISERVATVSEYQYLRRAVNWVVPPEDACRSALAASLHGVVGHDADGIPVYMGRIIGDGLYGIVADLVVSRLNRLRESRTQP